MLADPTGDQETWPIEDLWTLREVTYDVIRESDPEGTVPWLVAFESEGSGDLDPEDTAGEIQIDL